MTGLGGISTWIWARAKFLCSLSELNAELTYLTEAHQIVLYLN